MIACWTVATVSTTPTLRCGAAGVISRLTKICADAESPYAAPFRFILYTRVNVHKTRRSSYKACPSRCLYECNREVVEQYAA